MLNYFLIILFYLLFIYLSWKNIKWGIYLIIALLPSYLIRFSILGIPTTLLEGMIWLLFIVWLIKLKKQRNLTFNPLKIFKNILSQRYLPTKKNLIPRSFRWPIILFLIASIISVFVSNNLQVAAGLWKAYFIDVLLFFLVFVYNIQSTKDLKKIIKILGLTVLVIGVFAIIQKFTGWLIPNPFWQAAETRRITTFFGYPNANALFIAPIFILTITNLLSDKKNKWLIYNLLVLALGFLIIFWTKSSGALIGLAGGLIFLLFFYKKTRLITLIIILLFSGLLLNLPQSKKYLEKVYISYSQNYLTDAPSDIQLRTQQWKETTTLLKDKPILGAGLANYQTAVKPYHLNKHIEIFLYPHNFFLNFWTETGLLGLIAIIWLLIIFFIFTYRNYHQEKSFLNLILASAMITLLAHGLFDVPYFKNDLAVLFWIIVGSVIVLYNLKNNTELKNEF
ncbi:O-antigen ligase family protein [Patescibacteria group bacterium]|nr:O-antigen ligase family protein [Patescibacteria group bacterium]